EKLHLMGRIDRVDVCEQGDKVYVKVIDYKSGNKSFDLAAVYMGLDLQLVVYLNAALEYISKKYDDRDTVIPAGIFYYHIDDPMINADGSDPMTDEEINEKILGELKMSGLVNSDEEVYRLMDKDFDTRSSVIPVSVKKDGEFGQGSSVASTGEFKALSDYVNRKISEMGTKILNGDIKIEPHKRSEREDPQCKYCDYAGICGYRGEGIVPEGIDSDSNDPKDDDTDS
nr:PD-(D/E)XK nuclease family protein [Lachnospiraceae bacterium]